MKSRLIINPVSGTDAAPDALPRINERLRAAVGEMDIVMTVAAGDALNAAERTAQDESYTHLFVAGGDGTLNEVLNGVARTRGGLERLTFGLIPLGTGNDFADALGLPEDLDAALGILVDGRVVNIDVGQMNERFFVNVSAGGFIAEVSDAVDPQLKSIAGKLAYLIGGAQVLMDYEPVSMRLQIKSPDEDDRVAIGERASPSEDIQSPARDHVHHFKMQMFAVCNSRLVGGGRLIAPHAIIDDGVLDVCVVREMPTLDFIQLLAKVSAGEHVAEDDVAYFRAREINMEFSRTIKVNTDGEVLETAACRYQIFPRAARFLAGDAPFANQ